jgi:hypothetical protein
MDGSAPRCILFDTYLYDEEGGIHGWLQRCPLCIGASATPKRKRQTNKVPSHIDRDSALFRIFREMRGEIERIQEQVARVKALMDKWGNAVEEFNDQDDLAIHDTLCTCATELRRALNLED